MTCNRTLTTYFSFQKSLTSPYINRFLQPDTIIPNLTNPQSLNRYGYVQNNPVRFSDPTGHCVTGAVLDTVICAAIIGALVSVAVDAYVTIQVNHEEYSWKKAAVAATVGAVGGAVGVGLIGPVAEIVGAYVYIGAMAVAPIGTSVTVGMTAEVATGAMLSAGTNVLLSPVHRGMDRRIDGAEFTWASYQDDIVSNWENDAFIGATSYTISTAYSASVSSTFYPPQNSSQNMVYGITQGAGIGASNTDFLDAIVPDFNMSKTIPKPNIPKTNSNTKLIPL